MFQIAGKLHIQISKLGGSCLERYGDTTEDIEETDPALSAGAPMIVRVCLKGCSGHKEQFLYNFFFL